jgi:hypothetical protein
MPRLQKFGHAMIEDNLAPEALILFAGTGVYLHLWQKHKSALYGHRWKEQRKFTTASLLSQALPYITPCQLGWS